MSQENSKKTKQTSTDKTFVVYELDKSHPLEWTVVEHTVVGDKIVKSEILCSDIKIIAKRKLELKLFTT